ncbi:S8 family serine peptidase [Massilia horti]|uniref:Tandem-95 repeat protein n=1 Tax=Massilia horti TaxID=2562153 RepID=A0A4Y9SZH2_9BURK|nr:S8 family serine peptidase [Massilia horti]TFW32313.1 tandem-95 repeat protein [Massilia horti]
MRPNQVSLALALACGSAAAGVITPELASEMANHRPDERLPVIVQLAERVNLLQYDHKDRRQRDTRLLRALRDQSARALERFGPQLDLAGAVGRKTLWINNSVAASVPVHAIAALAKLPAVARVQYDAPVKLAALQSGSGGAGSPGWNLAALHVPEVWNAGVKGAGVVVANMDTGVDLSHPDLEPRWRGGSNSWFDPFGQYPVPGDSNGHGTQTMGLIVGGGASGAPIGVAPQARWIAARIFDERGRSTLSVIHQAFQWLLDPDGDPATVDAPDVVNASWGLTGGTLGACNMEFNEDIKALTSAGIAVVFSAGNDGPAPATAASPAANPAAFAVGSVDTGLAVAAASSRGPSGCDGTIFPQVVAPGVGLSSSDLSFGGLPLYATVSGTSYAAPHVSGTLALLAAAFPSASVFELENAVMDSAADIDAPGADNNAGHGLVDAMAAYQRLAVGGAGGHTPVFTSLPATDALVGQTYRYPASASDADGGVLTFALAVAPSGMTIDPSRGLVAWTPTSAQAGANPVVVTVTDPTARSASQSFSILVAAPNRAPQTNPDSYSVQAGAVLSVAAPGVLANDQDPDGDKLTARLVAGPSHGTLTLPADGSLRYTPASGFIGSDSFTYRADDGKALGGVAAVTIAVLAAPPVARDDSFTAALRRSSSYTAVRMAVLANDTASAGASLVKSSVTIGSKPNHGGSAVPNSDGTVSYTPAVGFSGSESFTYQVRDSRGLWSAAATVFVTVK